MTEEAKMCGARFPVEVGGWGAFVCGLRLGHEGNHIGKIKIGEMHWMNTREHKKEEKCQEQLGETKSKP